ncbi:MAG TPA: alpha/beta hydrolase [Sphingobium sp.]|nr:alpha/beta hydrolase [Sphingobium sp.]
MTNVEGTGRPGAVEGQPSLVDRIAAYPPQEPLSAMGQDYADRIVALGAGLHGVDHQYGEHSSQSLTVFPAAEPNGIIFVFFHGGGWTNGYKEWMYFMAPSFTARGITFVSATYRLAPEHVFPIGLDDCADAVAWVERELRPTLGSDTSLFIGGHSAGGHYSSLLAVTNGWRADRGLRTDLLDGVVSVSGTYRFGEGSGLSMRPRFLGADPANDRRASPLYQLSTDSRTSFFLSYGSNDFPHLITQAEEMQEALAAASVPVQTEIIEGRNHFDANIVCKDPNDPWVTAVVTWMEDIHRAD